MLNYCKKYLRLTGLKIDEPRRNTEAERLTRHDPRLTDQPV